MFQALRIPDFRLLWGGGLISSLGSWLLVLAIPAHILAATGSLRDTGLTLAAAVPAAAGARPGRGGRRRPLGQAAPDDRGEPVLRGRGGGHAARHLAGTVLGAVCRAGRREHRRRAVRASPAGSHAGHRRHRPLAEQRQLADLSQQRHRPADRRPARRRPAGRLRDQVADLRGRPQLPAGRRRHVHDVPVRRRAPGPECRGQQPWPAT